MVARFPYVVRIYRRPSGQTLETLVLIRLIGSKFIDRIVHSLQSIEFKNFLIKSWIHLLISKKNNNFFCIFEILFLKTKLVYLIAMAIEYRKMPRSLWSNSFIFCQFSNYIVILKLSLYKLPEVVLKKYINFLILEFHKLIILVLDQRMINLNKVYDEIWIECNNNKKCHSWYCVKIPCRGQWHWPNTYQW